MLKLISLGLAFYSYLFIRINLLKLPRCIPTHFNAAGEADGWGSPDTLWVLLGAQILTSALLLIVPYLGERFPSMVHLGSRRLSDYTAGQVLRMAPLLHDLAAYLSIVMNIFFVVMLRAVVGAAQEPHPHLHVAWPMGFLIGGMLCVMLYYLKRFNDLAQDT
jgi:hypothetical protein